LLSVGYGLAEMVDDRFSDSVALNLDALDVMDDAVIVVHLLERHVAVRGHRLLAAAREWRQELASAPGRTSLPCSVI